MAGSIRQNRTRAIGGAAFVCCESGGDGGHDQINVRERPLTSQHLTKSRYIAGLQCLRRLWTMVNEPQPYEEPPPGSPMDIGREIGRKAHLLFPGGAPIDEGGWQHAQAVARTTALMTDEHVPAIFEGAFEFEDIRIRVDVLERLANGTWGLREVKSSGGPKDYYFDDIALQLFVLKGTGVVVSSVELLHVNTAYARPSVPMMMRQRPAGSLPLRA